MQNVSVDLAWQYHRSGQLEEAEKIYRVLLQAEPGNPELLRLLGNVLRQRGNLQESLRFLEQAVHLRPAKPTIQLEYGTALAEAGRNAEAVNCLLRCISLDPNRIDAYARLAHVHLNEYNVGAAINALEHGLKVAPDDAGLLRSMGHALVTGGGTPAALRYFRRVLAARPQDPEINCDIGLVYRTLGNLDEAEHHLQRCLSQTPDDPRAIAGLADVLMSRGETQQALQQLTAALGRGVQHPDLHRALGRIALQTKQYDEGINLLQATLAEGTLPAPQQAEFQLALGALLEGRGDCDQAMAHYQAGNELLPTDFEEDAYRDRVTQLIQVMSAETLAAIPRASIDTTRPIFILGMPRSGTTLVEQVLACHPDVYGAGELRALPRVASQLPALAEIEGEYPACITSLTQEAVDDLASRHLQYLARLSADERFITDKLPQNYFNLGLISILLPQAKIIHCQRDEMDNCLSCFATGLAPQQHPYATNLHHIGVAYREYERLMAHWREVLQMPIFDVRYETMVGDQEATTRALLEFCGLDWHEDCLRFHESGRHAATASQDQVTQPIYQTSIGRAERFEAHLGSLRDGFRRH